MSETNLNEDSGLPAWLLKWRGIILLVIGVFTAWNTYTSSVTTNELKIKADQQEQLLRQMEFENQVRFKVFEEVKRAVSSQDLNLQEAVLVMVDEMLAGDSAFREKMRTIIMASNNVSKSVKSSIVKTGQFETEESVHPNLVMITGAANDSESGNAASEKSASISAYLVDVFYMEENPEDSKRRAGKVADLIRQKHPDFIARVRLLPRQVNARAGYRVDGNQIRYEAAETLIAKELLELLHSSGIFENEEPVLYQVGNDTPGYLSVFVRQ